MFLSKTIDFLKYIGLKVSIVKKFEPDDDIFLPNILIKNGELLITPNADVGDILHEAGHIAVYPSAYRPFLNGFLDDELLIENVSKKLKIDEIYVSDDICYSSEYAAIAWSFYACKYLKLNPYEILDPGFNNDNNGNVVETIEIGLLSRMGSAYSTALYYNGMLANKNSQHILNWLKP